MNAQLFKSNLKTHGANMLNYGIGSVLYMWLLIWVFPSIAKVKGMDQMLKNLPQPLVNAVGLESGFNNLGHYLAGEFFGLIFLLMMAIYAILSATQLIARLVDRGSMAYLLTTPNSRTRIAVTQAGTMFCGLLVISLLTTVGGILGTKWFVPDSHLDSRLFLQLNVLGFLVFLVVGAYSFLFSCLFNDEKYALSASAGVTVLFYAFDMTGKLSTTFQWMRHFSLFRLYEPQKVMAGQVHVWTNSCWLAVAAVVLFSLAIVLFKRRDLPL